jgi:hypothetical protein
MQFGPLWPHDLPWIGATVLALAALGVWLSRAAPRLDLAQAACAFGCLSMALISVGGWVFAEPAPLALVAQLGRAGVVRADDGARLAVIGTDARHTASVLLLTAGRRPTDVCTATDPAGQAAFLREFGARPGRKLLVLDERTWSALPDDLRERLEIVAERTGLQRQGLRSAPPPALAKLLRKAVAVEATVRLVAWRDEGAR